MAEEIQKIILVLFYFFTTCGSLFCGYVVVKYHENKPLGMQTLLSKAIVILVKAFSEANFISALTWSLIAMLTPMNQIIAIVLSFANVASTTTFMLGISTVLITKYLSIYHSTFLAILDEGLIVPSLRVIVFGFPWMLAVAEHVWLRDIRTHWAYLHLTETVAPSLRVSQSIAIFNIIVLFNLILMVFVYSRIEYDHKEDGYLSKIKNWFKSKTATVKPLLARQHQQPPDDINNDTSGYNINVFRILCFLAVIVVCFITFWGAGFLRMMLIRLLFSVICPLLFILSHSGIKACMKHQLKCLVHYFTSSFAFKTK